MVRGTVKAGCCSSSVLLFTHKLVLMVFVTG